MKPRINLDLREAARLTLAGKLSEAVSLIQQKLHGPDGATHNHEPMASSDGSIIDSECELITSKQDLTGPEHQEQPEQSRTENVQATSAHDESPGDSHLSGLWSTLTSVLPQAPFAQAPAIHARTAKTPAAAGQFISGSYANHAGRRDYKLYIPAHSHGQPLPMIVMLHGCTQNPDDFARGTQMNAAADDRPCFVLYPAQNSKANGSSCWNWFMTRDQQRDQGEPAIIAGMTRHIVQAYGLCAGTVYVSGLSAGGAMALILAATYPDVFAAAGIHSGLPYAAAVDMPSALALMSANGKSATTQAPAFQSRKVSIPVIVFHGDRDTTVHPDNGRQVIAQCTDAHHRGSHHEDDNPHVSTLRGRVPNGHAYTRTVYKDRQGDSYAEHWSVHGAQHAWSGGNVTGTFTDPKGPDATREMLRFFHGRTLPK